MDSNINTEDNREKAKDQNVKVFSDYVAEAIALLLLLFSFLTLWLNWSSLSDPISILSNATDEPISVKLLLRMLQGSIV